ncbi:hypothetical protein [Parafrankia sp. FMc2]
MQSLLASLDGSGSPAPARTSPDLDPDSLTTASDDELLRFIDTQLR